MIVGGEIITGNVIDKIDIDGIFNKLMEYLFMFRNQLLLVHLKFTYISRCCFKLSLILMRCAQWQDGEQCL